MDAMRIVDQQVKAIEDQIKALSCDHSGTKPVRYRLASNGAKMFKMQCSRCGKLIGDWISHDKIENKTEIKPIDDELPKRYRENCFELERELLKRKREIEKDDFFEWYNEYLLSPEWYEKRESVLNRCNGICEGCRKAVAVEVHHITYQNVGNEFIFELLGLCKKCHDRYHEKCETEA